MSTFSSVVNKSGKKFAPKAIARRNVPSRAPPSTTAAVVDPPSHTQRVLTSAQDVNSSNTSQAESAAEEDATSSAPPPQAPQPNDIFTPLDIFPSRTDSVASASRTAEVLNPIREARKDATREGWAANKGKKHEHRVVGRKPQVQPTIVINDEVATTQPGASQTNQKQDANSQEQAPSPVLSTRSTRSQRGGTKRKSDSQAADKSDVASEYSAATSQSGKNVAATGTESRKRQKVAPKGPGPVSATEVTQDMVAIHNGSPIQDAPPPPATVVQADVIHTPVSRPKRKRRAKKTLQEVAADIVADAVGDTSEANEGGAEGAKKRKRHRKRKIPEGAEDHEIVPSEVKMADLVKDKRLGKGSKLEARLEAVDWDEVKKKRKEAEEEAEKQRELEREEKRTGVSARQDDMPTATTVPKMTIRDGQIVLEEDSRLLDRHAEIEQAADETVKELDVDDVTRRVNQSTVGKQHGIKQKGHWNEEMTDLFYKGLRMFGTDFMMISKMFPGMSRRHIKLKYTREERTNLTRVHNNLIAKEDVDIEEYSLMSNRVYEDPERVHEELRADEKRLRDEDMARRAREAEAEQGDTDAQDSNILQSREQGTAEPAGGDDTETTAPETESSAKENRFESIARSIVQRASAPKKAKKQTALARKRERKKKTGLEGTEEVVGSIEDLQRR
jgi:transcription factor TFIIIB component B''